MSKRWYVVHAYSGMEKSVARALQERVERAGMQEQFGKILVPTDFSDDANRALDYALELAAKVGASVHVAHFYALPLAPFGPPYGFASATMSEGIEAESKKALENTIAARARPSVTVTSSAALGDARSGIQEVASAVGADLICMGTHGRRGLSHVLLGSIAEYTVRVSKIPTLTVRAAAEADAPASGGGAAREGDARDVD
jgi:nucleotide-binding universal stress UspA family protein